MHHKKRKKEIQRVKTESSIQYQKTLIFGTLLSVFFMAMSFNDISNDSYIDAIGLMTFLGFSVFGVVCLNYLFNQTKITISKKRITSENRFKKKTYQNIQGYKEGSHSGKYQYVKKIIFKTKKGFLVIDSSSYPNYYEVLGFVSKNYQRLNDDNFKRYDFQQTLFIRIFFFFVSLLFLGIFTNRQLENIDHLENDLQSTQITLLANPKIERGKGRNKNKHIRILTKEYPEFEFRIAGDQYDATNQSILRKLRKGEKIEIGVKKYILETKLLQSKEPSFWTKYFHWKKINIYQLNHNNKNYISLIRIKMLRNSEKFWSWIFLIMGLFSVFLIFGNYSK